MFRRGLGVVAAIALLSGVVISPAQAATRAEMREALLTRSQINAILPANGGELSERVATRSRASYSAWTTVGDEVMSVTDLAIAHLGGRDARPRDVPPRFDDGWQRIRRTTDTLVQFKEEFAGGAVRVVIFRGVNAVSAVCTQVTGGSDYPVLTRTELRRCARAVAQEQFAKLLDVVG